MALLTHNRIIELVERGMITNVEPHQIGSASVDLTLGNKFMVEAATPGIVHLQDGETPVMQDRYGHVYLKPGSFCLATTREKFALPDGITAQYVPHHSRAVAGHVMLRSSLARAGLQHLMAGWADPGFHGTLTLELVNVLQYHTLRLESGMRWGQIVLWEGDPVPEEQSYATRGRYNGQVDTQQSKGVG